jgi:RNA methyltransferase, TrmH family
MLSKARIKFIKSLQLKKYRKQEQCFVVEGEKSVLELLRSDFKVHQLLGTAEFINSHENILHSSSLEVIEVKPDELGGLGEFATNNGALAIAAMKPNQELVTYNDEFVLMLDDIRDPGNLGAIIRIADWYGMTKIIASSETADLYNGKVIHSSMGSFTRMHVYYTELAAFLEKNTLPVLGTFLDGANVHGFQYGSGGIIVIGNEANGISVEVERKVTQRITIPRYGEAESLNAAIATAIICDNIRRGV